MITARDIVVIGILASGALATWYLARPGRQATDDTPRVEPVHRGYYLKAARILGTGPDGSLLYEIEAEQAEQQGSEDIAFTNVRVNYSPQSDVPWVVNADSAVIRRDAQRVLLRGHVTAVSQIDGNDTEIRTQYLELDPENYLAETEDRVQVRIGARSLTATGMLASLQDNRVQLKSNVSGKFAP